MKTYNPDKTHPEEFRNYLKIIRNKNKINRDKFLNIKQKAKDKTKLDRNFPSPLMTTTLAMISGLACEEFELMDEQDQIRFMNDIKHLLLGNIADDEMREDSRFAFAATMISRHIPHRAIELLRIKELIKIQYKNQGQLNSNIKKYGKKYLNTDKGIELQRSINRLDEVLKYLKNEELYEFDPDRVIKHAYLILLKALHEHPYKLRIWLRVLQYCSKTGFSEFGLFVKEYNSTIKVNKISAKYYRAFILQLISKLIINSAKSVIDDNNLLTRRRASARFLNGILKTLPKFLNSRNSKKFEISSELLLRCSIGTAFLMLKYFRPKSNELVKIKENLNINEYLKLLGGFNWESKSTYNNYTQEKYPLSSLIWWAESISNSPFKTEPGIVWNKAIKHLTIDNYISWFLLAKYPKKLTLDHINKIDNSILNYPSKRMPLSWQYDALKNLNIVTQNRKLLQKYFSEPLIKSHKTSSDVMRLDDWADWCNETSLHDPNDPRISEWTSLYIVLRIALMYPAPKDLFEYKIHPSNFMIPSAWTEDTYSNKTWNDWAILVEEWGDHVSLDRSKYVISKRYRIAYDNGIIGTPPKHPFEIKYIRLKGLSLILLGLIRASFNWPNVWNANGQYNVWRQLIRSLIEETHCSSYTRAILESCLLPRPKETAINEHELLLIQPDPKDWDNDTAIDPIKITDITDFIFSVVKAKEILERNQLSAKREKPRQLIPINLEQISRGEESIPEERGF